MPAKKKKAKPRVKAKKQAKPKAKAAKAKKVKAKPAAKKRTVAARRPAASKAAPQLKASVSEKQVEGGLLLGEVEDYFAHVGVVALTLKAPLSVGDMIRVKGHTTDITQKVESLQIEHQAVQVASAKDAVGIKVVDRARKGDAVYKI